MAHVLIAGTVLCPATHAANEKKRKAQALTEKHVHNSYANKKLQPGAAPSAEDFVLANGVVHTGEEIDRCAYGHIVATRRAREKSVKDAREQWAKAQAKEQAAAARRQQEATERDYNPVVLNQPIAKFALPARIAYFYLLFFLFLGPYFCFAKNNKNSLATRAAPRRRNRPGGPSKKCAKSRCAISGTFEPSKTIF